MLHGFHSFWFENKLRIHIAKWLVILRNMKYFTFMLPCIAIGFFLNKQPDALIIQIYSVIKFYMRRASSLPTIRSFLLYIWHW